MSTIKNKLEALSVSIETEQNKEWVSNRTATLAYATLGACLMSTLSFFSILLILVTK